MQGAVKIVSLPLSDISVVCEEEFQPVATGVLAGGQVLCHDSIGPLGVLSVPGQSMDVYLLKLQY